MSEPVTKPKLLNARQVQARLPLKASGKAYSTRWIQEKFLQDKIYFLGIQKFWWESDVVAELSKAPKKGKKG